MGNSDRPKDIDVWNKMEKKLDENEIPSAAHMLREHCEYFYENTCDSLRADVCYKSDGRWELGDYLNGAKKAFKEYLKKAKKSARSWGRDEKVQEFELLETQTNEIIQRTQSEHWGVNENVHYTRWGDFVKDDFMPVAEAFRDLENLYKCPECQGIISVNMAGVIAKSIKCPCGSLSWNLEMNNN